MGSLNPCCNGMLLKVDVYAEVAPHWGLNPCCNGMLLKVNLDDASMSMFRVLILVVMECF